MGHAHWSRNCPCCNAMGVTNDPTSSLHAQQFTTPGQRVSSEGFAHIYTDNKPVIPETDVVESAPITIEVLTSASDSTYDATNIEGKPLISIVNEQALRVLELSSRLESASYRIGYLEALVNTKDEEIKLLPDLRMRAANAIALEKKKQELEQKVCGLETELTNLKSSWWYRFSRWFFGIKN